MTSRPTSFDIAALAGVSQPTVSRALRGSPSVSPQTRQRIEAIARQLNYSVDKNASNLRSQHSNTLALLFFEDPTTDESNINPFFLAMLGSITRACAQQGYDLLISFQQLSGNWHVDYEDSRKADGIILLGYGDYIEYAPVLERLVEQDTHFVRWGLPDETQIGTTIGSDNVQGGRDATSHLIRLGRRHIAFLGAADEHYPEFLSRYKGYAQALATIGLKPCPECQVDAISSQEAGYAAMA
ncbi:MAG: LacI family transcriptional regulator, partial [Alphaproteobacteria bacterium]|nr:LacI family transcriptional regulator [Alphaproteobacteria bacterium]